MPTSEDHQNPAPDPFEGLVLDEDFVRGAQQKEGSARARMLADKWKKEPPVDTSFRPLPTPRRRFPWRAVLVVAAAVALVAALLNARGLYHWMNSGSSSSDGSAARPTPSLQAPETAPPTAPPTVVADPVVATLAHPFVGSPAEDWPEGAKAIVLPKAHAVGAYDTADVAAYLKHTKDFLVDSNLDPKVLAGGYPTAALALIDPGEKDILTGLKKELAHPSRKGDGTELFTRFNPDQALLDGSVVKVQGELTYKGDGKGGLAIHADYTFVYPLRPGPHPDVAVPDSGPTSAAPAAWEVSGNSTDVARSIVRRVVDVDIPDPGHYVHTRGSLWMHRWDENIGNSACGVYNGYVNPQFPNAAAQGNGGLPSASGPAIDPYDRSKPPADLPSDSCAQDSRS
ncbi:SCO2583/SCO2584 N-terminal domain-containing protein [Streptacidiphilus cavernicola]|uniref:Uncharacterized protein n=1 Tax=Streptacidiphilus cavernicola TaxID=3342716 RepID=A0ABV6VX86_9ACTN